jgi:heme exporter protein A
VTTEAVVRVHAEALTHRFGRRRTGISALTFDFTGPGVVAVCGTNGTGKSTLLRIVAGLLRPSEGAVAVALNGREVPHARRRTVLGLATPELSFYEEFSAHENLRFAAEAHGLASPSDAADAALARVGLQPRANDRVAAFSSGMKQRLRLAFALVHEPPLLMLDEPGSHLDEDGRSVVREVVAHHGRHGLVLLATNDPEEVALAERRLELRPQGLRDPA